MKKTPVAGTGYVAYSEAKLDAEAAKLKEALDSWEKVPYVYEPSTLGAGLVGLADPSKYPTIKPAIIKSVASLRPQALQAIKARVAGRLPKNGKHYAFLTPEVEYDIATDSARVQVVMTDTLRHTMLATASVVDLYTLERAKPGDWTVVDVAVEQMVDGLIKEAVKVELTNHKLKEQDTHDVPNQTKWSYTKKPRRSPVVREGTPSSPEVHPV